VVKNTPYGGEQVFKGEFQHTLDAKGRVIIPSRLRENLGDCFVVTRGLDHCIFVYPLTEWDLMEQKLKKLPLTNKNTRAFSRLMLSGAMEVEVDGQGRVLIPQYLREHAGIERDMMIVGVGSRVEIWDEDKWKSYYVEADSNYEQLAEEMDEYEL